MTKDEDWDFLTSLLEETPNTKLSLESELSPKKERVTKTHAPNFNPNGPYYTIPSASEQVLLLDASIFWGIYLLATAA